MVQTDGSCAFCYKRCSSADLRKCGGCKKRQYCSQYCQRADWSDDATACGQRHKVICKLSYGEEGTDWEVQYIDDTRGHGIVALRDFSRGDRIFAERALPASKVILGGLSRTEAVAVDELLPKGGTMREKLEINSVSTDDGAGLCIRLSMANHDCVPNACHYDEYKGVKILIARTYIRAGDEITISYKPWYNSQTSISPADLDESLRKWHITCLPSCKCKDASLASKLDEVKKLQQGIQASLRGMGSVHVSRAKLDKVERMVEEMELSLVNVACIYYARYEFFSMQGSMAEASKCRAKLIEFHTKWYGPKSASVDFDKRMLF